MSRELHPDLIDDFKTALRELADLTEKAEVKRADILGDARAWAATIASYHGRMAGLRALLRDHDWENADQYADPEDAGQPVDERERHLRGWRELVAFLEQHPEVPITGYQSVTIASPKGSDEDRIAEVDRLAGIVGATVEDSTYKSTRYYGFEKSFGDRAVRLSMQTTMKIPEPEPALPEAAEVAPEGAAA